MDENNVTKQEEVGEVPPTATGSMEHKLEDLCDGCRSGIKIMADSAKKLMNHSDMLKIDMYPDQRREMKANVMLAYRHLEDARMRIGKVLQAAGDGVSILDKPPIGG